MVKKNEEVEASLKHFKLIRESGSWPLSIGREIKVNMPPRSQPRSKGRAHLPISSSSYSCSSSSSSLSIAKNYWRGLIEFSAQYGRLRPGHSTAGSAAVNMCRRIVWSS
jgi:hypothetical protein